MKLNRNYIQTFVFILVYLFAIYFWSQPLQERGLPYGEYDAMSHFEVGDYMAYNDKSIVYLPTYIDLRYGRDNDFKPHTLWYAPPFHTSSKTPFCKASFLPKKKKALPPGICLRAKSKSISAVCLVGVASTVV